MFSKFFIDRPIFASVLSIVITLGGAIAARTLPIAQYPEITPPTVEVVAFYPGANANVVADTVAAPIEQQVNGVENMLYMSSQCTNDGTYTLTITFRMGVNLDMAQVLVQNRVSLAEPILPDLVKRRGISVKKKSPSILMIVNLYSGNQSQTNVELSNYATIQIKDELMRLDGVGDITYMGQRDYSMRIWLDPTRMASRGLTAQDVVTAIQQQNIQVAAGQIGQPPVPTGQAFQYTMTTKGRLIDSKEFGDIIVKTDTNQRVIRLDDVGRLELGAQSYDQSCMLDQKPTVALSVFQRPGTNAFKTAGLVRSKMEELKSKFPPGMIYEIVYDTTPFIQESVNEVFKTLRDAVILVAAVVLLFLQNWRTALIPLIAVPVAIVGTFAVMAGLGFSLNNLTLFGLVLAIGIVVDDAIVVVEAVEHHIEHGLSPRDATIQAMKEVSGPVVAIGLVLSAVFVPCAFISGIVGQFFRQFALTIATSTVISAFNSLTLSPALAALLMKPKHSGSHGREVLPPLLFGLGGGFAGYEIMRLKFLPGLLARFHLDHPADGDAPTYVLLGAAALLGLALGMLVAKPLNRALSAAFGGFNRGFQAATNLYTRVVGSVLRISALVLIGYGGLLYLTYAGFTHAPLGFIPPQDKGYLLVNVRLPDASSVERTKQVMDRAEAIAREMPGVAHTLAISGQSLLLSANSPNFGSMYVMLKSFHERVEKKLSGETIANRLIQALRDEILEGEINIYGAPPVEGLGTAGGFKLIVQDRGDNGPDELQNLTDRVVADGNADDRLSGLSTSFRANTPWLYLDIDRTMAITSGLSIAEVFNTLQVYLGSLYVNDFNRFGRTWQVNVQGDAEFRKRVEELKQLKIRNAAGSMVPFSSIATVREINGPVLVMRYNMYPSAAVNGLPAPGVSSGQAIAALDSVVAGDLPQSMRGEWTELAYLQLQTGNTAMYVFVLAVVLVFLVLAAQYESWSLPLAVILVVPMCLLCSVAGVLIAKMDINIFTQVGFIVLVGLACKNAILIVEFAKSRKEAGAGGREATLEACSLRLRPIVMTSLAFILGVVPLVLSEGAGAEMRRTLGAAVFAGMLGVTVFGIFLTPVFYFVIQWISDRFRGAPGTGPSVQIHTHAAVNGSAHATTNGHLAEPEQAVH